MSERNPAVLIADMIQAIDRIAEYTAGLAYVDFVNDNKTIDAVSRNFEILGEASTRLG